MLLIFVVRYIGSRKEQGHSVEQGAVSKRELVQHLLLLTTVGIERKEEYLQYDQRDRENRTCTRETERKEQIIFQQYSVKTSVYRYISIGHEKMEKISTSARGKPGRGLGFGGFEVKIKGHKRDMCLVEIRILPLQANSSRVWEIQYSSTSNVECPC